MNPRLTPTYIYNACGMSVMCIESRITKGGWEIALLLRLADFTYIVGKFVKGYGEYRSLITVIDWGQGFYTDSIKEAVDHYSSF